MLQRGNGALVLFHFGREEISVDLHALGAGAGWRDCYASGADMATSGARTLQAWATLWRVRGRG